MLLSDFKNGCVIEYEPSKLKKSTVTVRCTYLGEVYAEKVLNLEDLYNTEAVEYYLINMAALRFLERTYYANQEREHNQPWLYVLEINKSSS